MKRIIKHMLKERLRSRGIFPTRRTDEASLGALIRGLHPVSPGIELVRVGPDGDGGYLVPDDLDGIEACYSPGVDEISGFELACAERGMEVFMADRSVEGPAEAHERFHFTKKFLGSSTNAGHMTLDDWVGAHDGASSGDLLLQMDIEGGEYEVLLNTTDTLMKRFRIIVVEFHDLHLLLSQPWFGLASRAFEKLLQTHTCVHIHPNNFRASVKSGDFEIPMLAEFTFLRNDRVMSRIPAVRFPHPLDRENTDNPLLRLPACWFGDPRRGVGEAAIEEPVVNLGFKSVDGLTERC